MIRTDDAAEYRRWVVTADGAIGLTMERPDLGAMVIVQMGPWGPHRRLFRASLREATGAEVDWMLTGQEGPWPEPEGEE